jgi:hypothetical protein
MAAWAGEPAGVPAAQAIFARHAQANALARTPSKQNEDRQVGA